MERTYSAAICCVQDMQLEGGAWRALTAYASSSADGSSDKTSSASASSMRCSPGVGREKCMANQGGDLSTPFALISHPQQPLSRL